VFCGRVFIFLFQSFPLGDKSSVNLRGEFHTENVTTYDDVSKQTAKNDEDTIMADGNEDSSPTEVPTDGTTQPEVSSQVPKVVVTTDKKGKAGKGSNKKEKVDLDTLYPVFWSLQAYFSAPSKMFDSERFADFKAGLDATLSAFKNINTELDSKSGSRSSDEARKTHKRKRVTDDAEIGTSFNPKYLTSRDLFDLEFSDTAFRRHVLVQALILIDFMLSLTPNAKARMADATNKSVLYGFVLSEEQSKWAADMRRSIEGYLRQGDGGNFYFRMVDTVLSRDKNWVRWKAEGCPPIERPAVSVLDYMQAREHATKAYANKRLRPYPMGSLDLKFLSDSEALANIERLKQSDRVAVPSADSLMMGIMDDEMDIDMAQAADDKDSAEKAKSSKTWRLLRLSVKTKLARFDKFKDGENLNALFESPEVPTGTPQPTEGTERTSQPPEEGANRDTTTKHISFGGDSAQDEEIKDIPVAHESQDVINDPQEEETQPGAKPEAGSLAHPEENTSGAPEAVASSATSGDNLKEELA
jgi:THO complex subunit 1